MLIAAPAVAGPDGPVICVAGGGELVVELAGVVVEGVVVDGVVVVDVVVVDVVVVDVVVVGELVDVDVDVVEVGGGGVVVVDLAGCVRCRDGVVVVVDAPVVVGASLDTGGAAAPFDLPAVVVTGALAVIGAVVPSGVVPGAVGGGPFG